MYINLEFAIIMTIKKVRILLIILFIIFDYSFGKDADDVIKEVQKRYKSAEDVIIDFNRVFIWSLSDKIDTLGGKIYIMDDNFKYETEEQIFITDGRYVWSYSSITNQTIIDIYKSDEDEVLPKELVFNFNKRYNSRLIGRENVGNVNCYILEGIPKNENLEIKSIKVWIEPKKWVAKKIEYVNLNDNVIVYNISSVKFNNRLKKEFFKFESPQGAEIIDLRNQPN